MAKKPTYKELEKRIAELEAQSETIFKLSPDLIGFGTLNGYFTKINHSFFELLGYSEKEFYSKSFIEFVHKDDIVNTKQALVEAGKGKQNIYIENRYMCKNNTYKWIDWHVQSIVNKNTFIAIGRNITKRKRAEIKLQESKEKYRILLDEATDPIFSIDANGQYRYVNNAFAKGIGMETNQIIGYSLWDIFGKKEADKRFTALNEVFQTGEKKTIEVRIPNPEQDNYYLTTITPSKDIKGNIVSVICTAKDITKHKQSEKRLKETRKRIEIALKGAQFGVWERDVVNDIYTFDKTAIKILGSTPNNTEEWYKYIHPDDSQIVKEKDESVSAGNIIKTDYEYRVILNTGAIKWIRDWSQVSEWDQDGKQIKETGILQDITEQKKLMVELSKNRERVELALKGANLGLWDWDIVNDNVVLNVRALNYIKPTPKNSQDWFDLIHPNDLNKVKENDKALISGLTNILDYEYRIMTSHSKYRWIHGHGSVVERDSTGKPKRATGTIMDITLQKQTEEEKTKLEIQLQQAQKMESIGTLAGGIAHDFNNILFPIVGHSEMLLQGIPEDNPFKDGLNQIYTGALRASELVKRILTFSRQDSGDVKLMKMQPIIKEALKLIRSTIPTTIEIRQNLQSDCGAIKADPTQIHQIIMNLATNAYHAMEETGGEIKVNLKEVELEESNLFNPDIKPGAYACLSISDTGKGMENELIEKIFDPFFTTKETGKGTGMGLSVVHGIIKSMNGTIKVDSRPDKGTEFHIHLPIAEAVKEQQLPTDEASSIQNGTEHIFLIDDENMVATVVLQPLNKSPRISILSKVFQCKSI